MDVEDGRGFFALLGVIFSSICSCNNVKMLVIDQVSMEFCQQGVVMGR